MPTSEITPGTIGYIQHIKDLTKVKIEHHIRSLAFNQYVHSKTKGDRPGTPSNRGQLKPDILRKTTPSEPLTSPPQYFNGSVNIRNISIAITLEISKQSISSINPPILTSSTWLMASCFCRSSCAIWWWRGDTCSKTCDTNIGDNHTQMKQVNVKQQCWINYGKQNFLST